MTLVVENTATIIRTSRGLSIDGTRITLYDVMDFYTADYPREAIRDRLALTDPQIDAALAYIEAHYPEVAMEYKQILAQSEQNQQKWAAILEQHLAANPVEHLSPEQQELHRKFQRWKASRELGHAIPDRPQTASAQTDHSMH